LSGSYLNLTLKRTSGPTEGSCSLCGVGAGQSRYRHIWNQRGKGKGGSIAIRDSLHTFTHREKVLIWYQDRVFCGDCLLLAQKYDLNNPPWDVKEAERDALVSD